MIASDLSSVLNLKKLFTNDGMHNVTRKSFTIRVKKETYLSFITIPLLPDSLIVYETNTSTRSRNSQLFY